MTAGGQPINSAPVPEKEKNRYGFVFPLRPGETQFQVVFHLPYSGELNVDPKPLYGAQHFVVMVPKTMQFAAAPGADFQVDERPAPVRCRGSGRLEHRRRTAAGFQDFGHRCAR